MALERCYSKGREIKYLVLWHSLWPASFYCYSSEDVKRVLLMWLGLNKTCCIVFFICTILLCKAHVLFKCRSFFQLKFLLFFLYQMLLIIVLIVINQYLGLINEFMGSSPMSLSFTFLFQINFLETNLINSQGNYVTDQTAISFKSQVVYKFLSIVHL